MQYFSVFKRQFLTWIRGCGESVWRETHWKGSVEVWIGMMVLQRRSSDERGMWGIENIL